MALKVDISRIDPTTWIVNFMVGDPTVDDYLPDL